MVLLYSTAVAMGSTMPSFILADPSGKSWNNKELMGTKGLLVAFTCNHCPYAIAIWPRLIQLAEEIQPSGINTVAINPNINPDFPEDAPDKMAQKIKDWKISFPYLVDETQQIARLFDAQCTPDLYLFDANAKLVYHGRLDDNWQNADKVKHQELRNAALALANGQMIPDDQKPSMGCSIKWR